MQRGLNHDEHQFIASGELLNSKFLFPYKDYPYFHMPNLVFVYGMIFQFTDHLLLTARLFSVICATLALGVIFYITFFKFGHRSYLSRSLISAGAVILLATNPYFIYTCGRSWNHDLPMLCNLLAFVFHCRGVHSNKARWILLSGLFLGFAIGTRLSFLLNVIPFAIIIFTYPNAILKRKFYLLLSFCCGTFIAFLPSLVMFLSAPQQFIFGNFAYKNLNLMYHQNGSEISMELRLTKRFLKVVQDIFSRSENRLLFISFIIFTLPGILNKMRKKSFNTFEISFLFMVILCHFIGAFITGKELQYYYAPIPFIVLSIVYLAANLDQYNKKRWSLNLVYLLLMIYSVHGFDPYPRFKKLLSPHKWFPIRAHKKGMEIAKIVGKGPVLTVAPLFPLEGGVEIYEQLATGPFAWRISKFVSNSEREKFGIISEDDLKDFLKLKTPRAILTRFEGDVARPFINYARENNYKKLKLGKWSLWLQ
jgi:hypothetical protein